MVARKNRTATQPDWPQVSLGSDPEMMIRDRKGNYKSAIGIVHGTKKDRLQLGGGATAFYDNVMVECCPLPGTDIQSVVRNFAECFRLLAKAVYPFELVLQASHEYDEDQVEHPHAREFGCVKERDCYTELEYAAICPKDSTLRTAGGHVHIGQHPGDADPWPLLDEGMGRVWFIRCLDMFLGTASILMDNDPTSPRRRKLYGAAGFFRKTPYGVEYRTMGNFWLASPKIVAVVYDLVRFSLGFVRSSQKFQKNWDVVAPQVRAAITNADKGLASDLISTLPLPEVLRERVFEVAASPRPDFYDSWGLPRE